MASNIFDAKPLAGLEEQPVPLANSHQGNEKSDKVFTSVETRDASEELSDKDGYLSNQEPDNDNAIIITGEDAALHLLSLRDDGDASITFRSMVLSTGLSAFQATMTQIYTVC